jgi:hypothetical protein
MRPDTDPEQRTWSDTAKVTTVLLFGRHMYRKSLRFYCYENKTKNHINGSFLGRTGEHGARRGSAHVGHQRPTQPVVSGYNGDPGECGERARLGI